MGGSLARTFALLGIVLFASGTAAATDPNPYWYHAASNPSEIVLNYLRLMEEGRYELAYTLLSEEHVARSGLSPKQFAEHKRQHKKWNTAVDVPCDTRLHGEDLATVRVHSFSRKRGQERVIAIDFELELYGSSWKISESSWASDIPCDAPNLDIDFDGKAASISTGYKVIRGLLAAEYTANPNRDSTRRLTLPSRLPDATSPYSDTSPEGAARSLLSAIASSQFDYAFFYVADTGGSRQRRGAIGITDDFPRFYWHDGDAVELVYEDTDRATLRVITRTAINDQYFHTPARLICRRFGDRWKVVSVHMGKRVEVLPPSGWNPCAD